uniref:Uncharacterized protein n=1 Tax=Globodera rostochiensis TaxID=31243 RepID=A0A914HL61_GLORO
MSSLLSRRGSSTPLNGLTAVTERKQYAAEWVDCCPGEEAEKEEMYLGHNLVGFGKWPLLPHTFTNYELGPFTVEDFNQYSVATTDGAGTCANKFAVLLFLDPSLLPGHISIDQGEKEELYLGHNLVGFGKWPLLPHTFTNYELGPFTVEDFNQYSVATTDGAGTCANKFAVLLFLDSSRLPGHISIDQGRNILCHVIETHHTILLGCGAKSWEVIRNDNEDYNVVFIFFASPVGITKIGNGLSAVLRELKMVLDNVSFPLLQCTVVDELVVDEWCDQWNLLLF